MSSTADTHNPAIDNLIESSNLKLKWIPYLEITHIKRNRDRYFCHQIAHYALHKTESFQKIMLLSLGNDEICTPMFVSEFARIYSLPTSDYKTNNDDFKRYSTWLENRNKLIKGFTKHEDNYCMVADRKFCHYYDQYGFCSVCRILRCSPVWCICGHKKLSNGWTSQDEKLNDFIKKSQMQTNSANEVYLEWIPYDFMVNNQCDSAFETIDATLNHNPVKLIPYNRWSFDFVKVNIQLCL